MIGTREQVLKALLDLSKAATDLFDLIESDGLEAPLDNPMMLVSLVNPYEDVRSYYHRRNLGRMMALGVTPEQLARIDVSKAMQQNAALDGQNSDGTERNADA